MPVKCITPYTPILYSKTGVYKGIPIFLIFVPNHRLWPRRGGSNGEAVLTCTYNQGFEQTYKNYHFFPNEIVSFNAEKILCILHGQLSSQTYRCK